MNDDDWQQGIDYPESVRAREHALASAAEEVLSVARDADVPLRLAEALIRLREALDA